MKWITRISAWVIFFGAAFGIFISISALVLLWSNKPQFLEQIQSNSALLEQAITTTQTGLSIVEEAIVSASEDINLTKTILLQTSDAVGNTGPTLTTVADLFGEDLLTIINDTQTSLVSAESSAQLIDDTLKVISAIPLIGSRYAPSQPLGESISQISTALSYLPASLTDIQEGIYVTVEDLSDIETSIESIADSISDIDTNLESAGTIISEYQVITKELHQNLLSFQEGFPHWLNTICYAASLLLAWIGIISIGFIGTGIFLLRQSKI